ncbi:hypothetical protein [Polaribacter sp.]|uniref:hypothetical protein n=1 Tax=Polaribacter sp. TaxID=1920175 RepID=UPI003EF7FA12
MDKLLEGFVIVGFVQGMIASIMFVAPAAKNMLLGLMNLTFLEESKEGIFMFRIFGLSSEYLFAFPVFQGLVLMIIFLEIINRKYRYVKYIPFILISIIFNARIGLFALPVVFLVYFLYLPSQRNSFKLIFKYLRILIFAGFFLAFCGFLMIQVIGFENFEQTFFRGVGSGKSKGHLYTLFDKMVFWPKTTSGFIFGEGRYLFGNEYDENSDMGYINYLLFGGLVYIFVYFYNLKRVLFRNMKNVNIRYKVLITSSFVLILISNFKGSILSNNGFIRALLILVFLHILNANKNNFIKINN